MLAQERASIAGELTPPFAIVNPAVQTAPLVLCSPHSGRVYPRGFLESSRLDPIALRRSEDCYVDDLFGGVAALGAPMIAARFPRAYLDANREPYELDPALFEEPPPDFANTQSARVMGGLGTVARVVSDGENIYAGKLPLAVAFERIDKLYFPFHAALTELLEATRRRFGFSVLADCHSMPSSTGNPAASRPDFILGDRFGASCGPQLIQAVRQSLQALGYAVQFNRPYAGGYITEHYGVPAKGVHAFQIEINRALYLNEATLARTQGFNKVQRDLTAAFKQVIARQPEIFSWRDAAE